MQNTLNSVLSSQALEYLAAIEGIEPKSVAWGAKLADVRATIHAAAADKTITIQEWRVLIVRASKVGEPANSY